MKEHEYLFDWLRENNLYDVEDFHITHLKKLWNYWEERYRQDIHSFLLAREKDKDKELAGPNDPLIAYIQKVRANANTDTIFEAGTVMTQSWMEQGGFLGVQDGFNQDEWVEVGEKFWQNKRAGTCFSENAGKTWWCLNGDLGLPKRTTMQFTLLQEL